MAFSDYALPIGLGSLIGGPFGAAAGLQYAGAQQAAEAQQQAAEAQLNFARESRQAALGLAAPTTQELSALDNQLKYQAQAVGRQEQLLNSLDPALMEAGKQALALLRGQQSTTLDPLRQERERQRSALTNSLIAKYGQDGLASSAGIEALNRFDQQTAQGLASQQQSQLGALLGAVTSARPDPYQAVAANAQTLGALGNIQTRQVNASLNSATPVYQSAGAPFVSQALQGQNLSAIGEGFNRNAAELAGVGIGAAAKGRT